MPCQLDIVIIPTVSASVCLKFIKTEFFTSGTLPMCYSIDNMLRDGFKKCVCEFPGDIADLIFIFFDPIGQALCKRTLSLVEKLNEKHAERIRFYLSKADEAGHEADRQVSLILVLLKYWSWTRG